MAEILPFCEKRQKEWDRRIIEHAKSFVPIDRKDFGTIPKVLATNYLGEPVCKLEWLEKVWDGRLFSNVPGLEDNKCSRLTLAKMHDHEVWLMISEICAKIFWWLTEQNDDIIMFMPDLIFRQKVSRDTRNFSGIV